MKILAVGKGRKMVSRLSLMALVIAVSIIVGCAENNKTVDEIVFMAGYKPQANLPFVGVYVADNNGYFEQQSLNVDIKHASSGEHVKLLLSGDIQFSTSDAGSVLKQISNSEELDAIKAQILELSRRYSFKRIKCGTSRRI